MTTFQIVALYVALALILNPLLMFRIGLYRQKNRINLGDGGDPNLLTRIRTHGNFTEVAPLILIGLIAMAMMGASPFMLHLAGGLFILGRILHILGMSGLFGQGRFFGTILTIFVFFTQGIYLLYLIFLHGPV